MTTSPEMRAVGVALETLKYAARDVSAAQITLREAERAEREARREVWRKLRALRCALDVSVASVARAVLADGTPSSVAEYVRMEDGGDDLAGRYIERTQGYLTRVVKERAQAQAGAA